MEFKQDTNNKGINKFSKAIKIKLVSNMCPISVTLKSAMFLSIQYTSVICQAS